MARKRKTKTLGSVSMEHRTRARSLVERAESKLKNIPPTCGGGVNAAMAALIDAADAAVHAESMDHVSGGDKGTLLNRARIAKRKAGDKLKDVVFTVCVRDK